MEIIIREYGRPLLDVLCIILLVIVLFNTATDAEGNQGVFAIAGAHMTQQANDYSTYIDFDVFVNEGVKESPTIVYSASGQMYATTNQLASFFTVKGYDGSDLPYKVIRVTDYSGNEYPDAYDTTLQTVTFPKPGIYILRIQAVDDINQKTIVDISVPVSKL